MGLDGEGMNRQQAAEHVEECMRLVPGHLHFPARDVGKFVQDLHADFYSFDMKFVGETATRIINEVKGVNRVVYDVTSKPPGTIEWE